MRLQDVLVQHLWQWIFLNKDFEDIYIHPIVAYLLKALVEHSNSWNHIEVNGRLMGWLLIKYEGTTMLKDRCLLEIMLTIEKKGFPVSNFMLFWHVRQWAEWETLYVSNTLMAIDSDDRRNECVASIDSAMMWKTIETFQVKPRSFIDGSSLLEEESPAKRKKDPRLAYYDPQFFLPLMYLILKHSSDALDFRQLIEVNLIGLAIITLTSADSTMRQIASLILQLAYEFVERSRHLKEKPQLLHFLYTFKNTIMLATKDDHHHDRNSTALLAIPQMPFIFCLFMAKSITMLLQPEHHLYMKINGFTLQRALLDSHDIPLFYALFHSTHENTYHQDRHFLLNLLAHGLKTLEDVQIFQRRHVFELLCSLYESSIADISTRKLILQVRISIDYHIHFAFYR
jgi:hypothetical protein